ncbi:MULTISPECIES: hypothetical protein [unclassified Achromobacter]|jgi:hypothetical protein|uniref:hypothetical protein n=1 Tax=unclassified Achromobacter TaxID=2626865 RepID=UPI001F33D3B0|nr:MULTISPECIES: hypothetical protein [unclassified Achromobacter]
MKKRGRKDAAACAAPRIAPMIEPRHGKNARPAIGGSDRAIGFFRFPRRPAAGTLAFPIQPDIDKDDGQ